MVDTSALAGELAKLTPQDLRALADAWEAKAAQEATTAAPETPATPTTTETAPTATETAPEATGTVQETTADTPGQPTPTEVQAATTPPSRASVSGLLAGLNLSGSPDQVQNVVNWVEATFGIKLD